MCFTSLGKAHLPLNTGGKTPFAAIGKGADRYLVSNVWHIVLLLGK